MLWTVLLASETIVLNVFTVHCLVLLTESRVSCCANSVSMLLARVIRLDLPLLVAAFHISKPCTDPIQPHNASPPPLDRHQDDDYGDDQDDDYDDDDDEEEEEEGEHH